MNASNPTPEQIAQWHELLSGLAEITQSATTMNEVAERAIRQGLLHGDEPCRLAWAWSDQIEDFSNAVAEVVWDPAKDPYITKEDGIHGRQ